MSVSAGPSLFSFKCVFEFFVTHKVGNIDISVLLRFENKEDREISYLDVNSKHHVKCHLALKLIQLSTISNLFPLGVIHNCLHCQLCVLRGNSNLFLYFTCDRTQVLAPQKYILNLDYSQSNTGYDVSIDSHFIDWEQID